MNEVYFINPKFTNGEDYYELPLGMAYLISSVKKNTKSNVKVIDLALNKNKINDYKKIISKGSPIICMSVYSYFVDDIINICKEIKEINNKVKIILGGPHITIDGENFISENLNFDYGIKGEGEYSLPNLINAINNNTLDNDISNIEGLIYRYNGKIKSNPYSRIDNLGEIPSVIEGIKTFDLEKIKNITKSRISYIASRGCPFNCIFCSSSSLWGRKYKQVPIDIVIKDIKELSILGFKHIDFRDDFFTVRKDWTYKLAKVLKELNIEWTCQTRLDSVDRKLLQTMYDSGCTIIRFGIESFNDKSLKLLKKGETYEQTPGRYPCAGSDPGLQRPVLHHEPGRPRRRGHQDRDASLRRSDPRLGSHGQRLQRLLCLHQPQQKGHDPESEERRGQADLYRTAENR